MKLLLLALLLSASACGVRTVSACCPIALARHADAGASECPDPRDLPFSVLVSGKRWDLCTQCDVAALLASSPPALGGPLVCLP